MSETAPKPYWLQEAEAAAEEWQEFLAKHGRTCRITVRAHEAPDWPDVKITVHEGDEVHYTYLGVQWMELRAEAVKSRFDRAMEHYTEFGYFYDQT